MNERANEDFERTQNLVLALGRARNLMAAELNQRLKHIGVNLQERGILLTLERESVKSPAALSKLLGVHPGRMTRVLDKLERNGLVERSRNGLDRRIVDVSLTQAGREKLTRDASAVSEVRRENFDHFTKADFEALSTLLFKLLRG